MSNFLCVCKFVFPNISFLRTYCETDIDPAHRKHTQLQAAVRYLLGKDPELECVFSQYIHLMDLYFYY